MFLLNTAAIFGYSWPRHGVSSQASHAQISLFRSSFQSAICKGLDSTSGCRTGARQLKSLVMCLKIVFMGPGGDLGDLVMRAVAIEMDLNHLRCMSNGFSSLWSSPDLEERFNVLRIQLLGPA